MNGSVTVLTEKAFFRAEARGKALVFLGGASYSSPEERFNE